MPPAEIARRIAAVRKDFSLRGVQTEPWVEMPPTACFEDIMEFDRATCDRGLRRYTRRLDATELAFAQRAGSPDALSDAQAILVVEIAKGCRVRLGVRDAEVCRPREELVS